MHRRLLGYGMVGAESFPDQGAFAAAQAARPLLKLDPARARAVRAAAEAAELARHPLLRLDPAHVRAQQAAQAAAEAARRRAEAAARLVAVAVSPAAIVFAEPDETSPIVTTLPQGTPVVILEGDGAWCRVGLQIMLGGWELYANDWSSPIGWMPCAWLGPRR